MIIRGSNLQFYVKRTDGGRSKEEFLLGCDERHLVIYPHNYNDPPRSSKDKDGPHDHTRKNETHKYLGKSCYHRIKCTASTFLVAFMWRRPLNNVTLATTTHRKLKEVSDEIGT